jgi:hypothetical protein
LAFRVVTERDDIWAVGSSERVDASFGLRTVQGEIVVRSADHTLDEHLEQQTSSQMITNLKKREDQEGSKRTDSFDDCFVESRSLIMEAGQTAATTYLFSATRVREE